MLRTIRWQGATVSRKEMEGETAGIDGHCSHNGEPRKVEISENT